MPSEHTAKAFDSDLQELTRLVAEMGGLAERMIVDSVKALIRRDVALGQRVVAGDAEIDDLQHAIEERAVLTIARRQPMAVTCAKSSAPCESPAISSGSAISPKTWASGSRRWRATSSR